MLDHNRARALASEALDDLSDASKTLDGVIRKAIRVATAFRHVSSRMSLEMQLLSLVDRPGSGLEEIGDEARRLLSEGLLDADRASAHVSELAPAAIDAYFATRQDSSDEDLATGQSVYEIEETIHYLESKRSDIHPDNYKRLKELRRVLNSVRNAVSRYLISVESRVASPKK